jgi:hypothetical protein
MPNCKAATLSLDQTNSVHTVHDVLIFASGPGAARFNATTDNTQVVFARWTRWASTLEPMQSSAPDQAVAHRKAASVGT